MPTRPTLTLAAMGVAVAVAAQARTLEVGPGKEFKQPSDAIGAAKAGDVVRIAEGEYFDCATARAPRMVIEGVGDAAKVVLTDKACSGKGMLITTGNGITVRNLTLTRARVPDGPDGTASYEIEVPIGGSLVVRNSTLEKGPHAENHSAAIVIGAEGVSQPTREITIENNTFRNDGSWNTLFVRNLTATEAMLRG